MRWARRALGEVRTMGQISGDEIRAAEFPVRAHGYIRHQVRLELARIADLHEKGFAPARYAPPVTRQPRQLAGGRSSWHGRAYDADAVDRFFAALAGDAPPALRTLPEFPVSRSGSGQPSRPGRRTAAWQQYAGDCQAEWHRVAELPGERMHSAVSAWTPAIGQLTGSAGQVLLAHRRNTRTLATGQVLRVDSDDVGGGGFRLGGWQVTDTGTGQPILWIRGLHFDRNAGAYVLLPGQRYLVFPVTGTQRRNAVMTAVTESGTTAMWFRRTGPRKCEIVVNPDRDLSTELLCVADQAARWLPSYFAKPGGGG